MAKTTKKKAATKKCKLASRRRKPALSAKPKRRRAPFSAPSVLAAALSSESMSAAAFALKSRRPLADVLADFPRLEAAWTRGRLLRRVGQMAATAMSISESAQALGVAESVFRDQLESDPEIRDTWNSARIAAVVEIKAALVAAAQAGKAAAITPVLAALRREIARPAIDFRNLSVNQTVEATGYSRQTIHAWRTKHGAPANSDGTICLPELLAWRESWTASRAVQSGGRPAPVNRFQDAKTRKLLLDLRAAEGSMLPRDEVLSGLLARHQALLSSFRRKSSEMSITLANQEPDRILAVMEKFLDEIRRQMLDIPSELRLPPSAAEQFAAVLASLDPEGSES